MILKKMQSGQQHKKLNEAPTEKCDIHTSAPSKDVPNVVGKNENDAKKMLTDAGFKVEISKDQDPSKAKGIVLKQSSTKASEGDTITITVNQYEKVNPTTVDDTKKDKDDDTKKTILTKIKSHRTIQ